MPARPTLSVRRLLLAGMALLPTACATYEGGWAYLPDRSVHQTVVDGPDGRATIAQVTVRVVGVLRARDGEPRRLHARLTVENRTGEPLRLLTAETSLETGLAETVPCSTRTPVEVGGHDQRWLDLLFELPSKGVAPRGFLQEVTLRWTLEHGTGRTTSEAPFRRVAYRSYADPYWQVGWYGVWDPYGSAWDPWPYRRRGIIRWSVDPLD